VVARPLKLSPAEVDEVWTRWRSGQAVKVLAREMRIHPSTVRDLLHRTGGIRPAPMRRWEVRLSPAEREEISRGMAAGLSLRVIAAHLGRAASTISREVLANGGRSRYRAAAADRAAWTRAARPKATKLASSPALAALVAAKLELDWSPEQIAGWLKIEFPADGLMQVSHESIYRSLFVQTRGSLRKELTAHLRTGRVTRRPAGARQPDGRGLRPGILNISQRPAEAADRAVPGHWEGDLVFGKRMNPVATLVERSTRFLCVGRQDHHPARSPHAHADVGPGPRDGRPRPVHHHHRGRGLLLRPQEPVAARQQREHQRPAASVPAPHPRLPHPDPGRLRRDRRPAQRTPSTDPRLQATITSTSRGVAMTA
jgi:hypothetical protein